MSLGGENFQGLDLGRRGQEPLGPRAERLGYLPDKLGLATGLMREGVIDPELGLIDAKCIPG
jgi:hypothetical protein